MGIRYKRFIDLFSTEHVSDVPMSRRVVGIILLAIFIIALLVRITAVLQLQNHPVIMHAPIDEKSGMDSVKWHTIAKRVVSENDWTFRNGFLHGAHYFLYEPLYVYFLSVIYFLFGYSIVAVSVIQAILGAVLVLLVYYIGKEFFNEKVGLIASFITALYGLFILYENLILKDFLVAFLYTFFLFAVIKAAKKPNFTKWLFVGLIAGLTNILKPNVFLPIALIWMYFELRKNIDIKKTFGYMLCVVIGAVIVISPVSAYNFRGGEKVLICAQGPHSFWIGNRPGADGSNYLKSLSEERYWDTKSQGSMKKALVLLAKEIKKQPKLYRRLFLRKWKMFWNAYEIPSNFNYYLFRDYPSVLRLPLFSSVLILPFCFVGMILALFRKKIPILLYCFIFGYALSVIFFIIQSRYRLAIMPLIIIFSAYAFYRLIYAIKDKKFMLFIVILCLLGGFGFFTKKDITIDGFFDREICTEITVGHYSYFCGSVIWLLREQADYVSFDQSYKDFIVEKSIEYFDESIKVWPDNAQFYIGMALIYEIKKDYDQAIRFYQQCLKVEPDNEVAQYNIRVLKGK